MKSLSTQVSEEIAKPSLSVSELYDIYLPAAISTPVGTTAILRLTTTPTGLNFYTPKTAPEPSATRGTAAQYHFWPTKRDTLKNTAKFQNDKIIIAFANVTTDWAQMIDATDWEGVHVVCRKIFPSVADPTADDCATLFIVQVDSARITNEVVQLTCSNGLGAYGEMLPRENLHTRCRHTYADDLCTMVRYRADSYKQKTCATGSTTTVIKSNGLTEDTLARNWLTAPPADIVAALADGSISSSSDTNAYTAEPVTFPQLGAGGTYDYFKFDTAGKSLALGQRVKFAGTTPPTGITFGTWYYILDIQSNTYSLSATEGGVRVNVESAGVAVTLDSEGSFSASEVKAGKAGYWQFSVAGDWGTNVQGYWQIPDAQAGLKNAALKPWIQFDFGTAKTPKLWRVKNVNSASRESFVRLIQFFSSTDNATWKFETYFEMRPIGNTFFDVLIPGAATARYWRICIRSRWAETLKKDLLYKVSAYQGSLNWWANGVITFAANTTTAALRNISRTIVESGTGELLVGELPTAPVLGDVFTIERGCAKSFNDCAHKLNTENFGGITTLPDAMIVR